MDEETSGTKTCVFFLMTMVGGGREGNNLQEITRHSGYLLSSGYGKGEGTTECQDADKERSRWISFLIKGAAVLQTKVVERC